MGLKDIWDKESKVYAERDRMDVVNTMDLPGHWMPGKGEYVLEAGCGAGAMMKVFAKAGGSIFGIDISPEMLKYAKDKGAVVSGDIRSLPYKNSSFDYVVSLGVIEHFRESEAAFKECIRVLKKGGRLFINVPNRHSFYFPLRWIAQKFGLYSLEYSRHFTLNELKDMGSENGLFFKDWMIQRFVPEEARGVRRIMMSVVNILDNISGFFINKFGNFLYVLWVK